MPRPPDVPLSASVEWLCCQCASGAERSSPWQPTIAVGGQPLAWVPTFTYLGSVFHQSAKLDPELNRRIQLASAAFQKLQRPFFQQKSLSLHVRLRVYRALVLSVLLYGCEGWALSTQQLQRLEVLHRQCLRTIVGLRLTDRISNHALHSDYGVPTIAEVLRLLQGRWLGHVARMPDSRITKQAMYSCGIPGGSASRGARSRASLSEHWRRQLQRRGVGEPALGVRHQPQLDHAPQHGGAAVHRPLRVAARVVVRRRPHQSREQRRLGQVELGRRPPEEGLRRSLDAVGPAPEVDRVQVLLEDELLGVRRVRARWRWRPPPSCAGWSAPASGGRS